MTSKFRKFYFSTGGGQNRVDYSKIDSRITIAKLKDEYDDIKQLSDLNLSKSDRKKIRQDLILKLYNELITDDSFDSYKELEAYLTLSKEARAFVKELRDAITGMTTMMSDYVNSDISFESWQAICNGRDKLKSHYQAKASAIKIAADAFKKVQNEWEEKDNSVFETVSVPAKIDRLTEEHLPVKTKKELAAFFSDKSILAEKTKLELKKFKGEQIKLYQSDKASYKLPTAK